MTYSSGSIVTAADANRIIGMGAANNMSAAADMISSFGVGKAPQSTSVVLSTTDTTAGSIYAFYNTPINRAKSSGILLFEFWFNGWMSADQAVGLTTNPTNTGVRFGDRSTDIVYVCNGSIKVGGTQVATCGASNDGYMLSIGYVLSITFNFATTEMRFYVNGALTYTLATTSATFGANANLYPIAMTSSQYADIVFKGTRPYRYPAATNATAGWCDIDVQTTSLSNPHLDTHVGAGGVGMTGIGYPLSTASKAAGNPIAASDWEPARQALYNQCAFFGTPSAGISTPHMVGGNIIALNDYASVAANCAQAWGNQPIPTNYSITNTVSSVRSTPWTSQITCVFLINESSASNPLLWFFNRGGELRLSLSHANKSTSQDISWSNLLKAFGQWGFMANRLRRLSGTTTAGLWQRPNRGILNCSSTLHGAVGISNGGIYGHYTSSSIDICSQVLATNTTYYCPSSIAIRVTLTDNHTNSWYDAVQSGTTASMQIISPAGINGNSVASPSVSVSTQFG